MKKIILAAFLFVSTISTNVLADIKMGIILGFTGPINPTIAKRSIESTPAKTAIGAGFPTNDAIIIIQSNN